VLRVVSDTGLNARIDPDTGATTTDVATNPVGPVVAESAYSNSFVGTGTALYYTIDTAGDALQLLGRPSGNAINGDLQTVGALGVGDVTGVAGFDIFGTNNQGLAALNIGGAATSDLFTVNLSTGAATRINTVDGGERVRGLAYARLPVATVFAITADNHLVSFKPLTPGTFDTDVAVTGLQGSEAIVGIDFRPSNGVLYAVTDAGRVYAVDATTGAVSGALRLSANPLDATAPFTALAGTRFGVDFSALDSLLPIQSDTGQNLRVDVDAGTVITDANLNPGTPQVVGTAFSYSYAGATDTFLYELDVATGTLVRQASNGVLITVGSFNAGTTFALEGGFDIAGGENGLSIAALQPTGATQSTLYRVNLGTGALTSLGLLGSSGTTVVRALAIRVQ
jgi:outer membrane protein assembly factor BamB